MNDEKPATSAPRSWLEKISQVLAGEPKDRTELVEILRDATERHVLDPNSLGMIENVLEVPQLRVRDIMLPRSQMSVIEKDMSLQDILPLVINTGHSRFPVIGDNKDEVIGVLLAKDLLAYSFGHNQEEFDLQKILRPAFFIPESKRLDSLLQEFRTNRTHMAIVVNEYGGVTGLITIENVLEQIVGDIEDEYDIEDDQDIQPYRGEAFSVNALTPIEEFNEYFKCHLQEKEVETIGGLVLRHFGYLPKRGDSITIEQFDFTVLRADKRRIYLLQVIPKTSEEVE